MGKNVFVGRGVRFDKILHGALITIGDGAHITSRVTILCHDVSCVRRLNHFYVAPVIIGENAFIGVNSIIMPGVRIGNNAIVGAGSVVTKDVPDGMVYGGIPARKIETVDEADTKQSNFSIGKKTVTYSLCRKRIRGKEIDDLIKYAYDYGGFIIK